MFLSKFWNLLLVIAITVLLGVLYLVPTSVNQGRQHNVRTLIEKDKLQIESILKMEARSRIDATVPFVVDQVVREQLAAAMQRKAPGEVPIDVKEKLLARLRAVNDELGAFKADILFLVDNDGVVVAQVGESERSSGYSMKGFPIVEAALRGYMRDDSWFFDGKLYRMAGRPVIHSGMYVGAVIHGQKIDNKLALLLAEASESQIGIYTGDHLVARAEPSQGDHVKPAGSGLAGKKVDGAYYASDAEINAILMDEVAKDQKYAREGKSSVLLSRGRFYVYAMKITGEARENNTGIVMLRKVPRIGGVSEFLGSISKDEMKVVPWWKIGILAGLLLVLGVLIVYFEGDRPKSRFLREVNNMVSREGERLNIYLFRGTYRKIADAMNRAIDKAVQVLVAKATSGAPSVNQILGAPLPDRRLSKPGFEGASAIGLDEIPPPPPAPAPQDAKGRPPARPPLPPPATAPGPAAQPPAPSRPPAAPAAAGQAAPPPAQAGRPSSPWEGWGSGLDEEETRIYEDRRESGSVFPQVPLDARPPTGRSGVPAAAPQPGAAPAADDPRERSYKRIYEEFHTTKIACGESVENLTYDRFKATLLKQEEAIVAKTQARRVEFKVYVKDGKAALKASPIK